MNLWCFCVEFGATIQPRKFFPQLLVAAMKLAKKLSLRMRCRRAVTGYEGARHKPIEHPTHPEVDSPSPAACHLFAGVRRYLDCHTQELESMVPWKAANWMCELGESSAGAEPKFPGKWVMGGGSEERVAHAQDAKPILRVFFRTTTSCSFSNAQLLEVFPQVLKKFQK